tara:strand:+ start:5128 stop:5262 length:135 start_codon:yes stop_codon:yes gene_type:complete
VLNQIVEGERVFIVSAQDFVLLMNFRPIGRFQQDVIAQALNLSY